MATQAELEILLDKSMNPSTALGQKVFKRSMIEILGDDYDFDNTPIRQIELDLFNMAALSREEMENAIRQIDLEFGRDPDGDTPLEDLDLKEIKEIYEEYMNNYAQSSRPPTISMAKSGGEVLSRPMFRPQIVRRQAGTPNTGEVAFDPRKFNILDKLGVISNKTLNMQAPDKEYQLNIDDAMTNPQLLDTVFEMITSSTGFDLESYLNMGESQREDYLKTIKGRLIFGKAEGGEMKSDAVGIADGLDQETPKADPNTEGVAKVSPAQYVELMNQVRGDEVPLEGRVQELAMTVGEKDAQDTPLSVLALVQPVFELQEKQGGLAAAPGAQQMMQQQNPMMMAKDGGIVHRFNGSNITGENTQNLFSALGESGVYDPAKLQIADALAKVYGVTAEPFDTQAVRKQYEQQLIDKEGLRDQAFLAAAPEFLQLGALALNPNATISDVITQAATGVARFGTAQGKKIENLKNKALQLALADKASDTKTKQAFIGAITSPLLEDAFKTTTESQLENLTLEELTVKIAGDKTQNLINEMDLTAKNLELSYKDENLKTDLLTKKAELEKALVLLENLPEQKKLENQALINQNKLAIAQIEAAGLNNQLLEFDISKRPILDALTIESQQIANLSAQLDLDQKPELLKEQLLQLKGNNEKLYKELDIFDVKAAQEYYKTQLDIEKLENEINNPKKDKDQIKAEADLRAEYNKDSSVKGLNDRNNFYVQIRNAILNPLTEDDVVRMAAGTNDEELRAMFRKNPNGAKDLVIMFNFMKMLDPDSVVREGEQILLKKTNPITQKFKTLIDTVSGGGFLGAEQKKFLLQETKILMDASFNQFNGARENYIAIGKDNFGDDFNANVQLPVPPIDSYAKDVESGLFEKLFGADTTAGGTNYSNALQRFN